MFLKKKILPFVIVSFLGTLGHFIYKWSGNNIFLGYFFPINESTWEHLKLLFFPFIFYSLIEYLFIKEKPVNYFAATAFSVLAGMLSIVTLFYTINGILGYNIDFINIAIYYISVIVTIYVRNKIIKNQKFSSNISFYIALIIIVVTALLFIIWTYNPPSIALFVPPAS